MMGVLPLRQTAPKMSLKMSLGTSATEFRLLSACYETSERGSGYLASFIGTVQVHIGCREPPNS